MIEWRGLVPEDEDELREFVCADAPARDEDGELIYDAELVAQIEAQTGIRGIQLPLPRGEYCVIGRDEEGIAAVCWWIEVHGAPSVKVLSAGVALRLRRRGLHVGDQLFEEVQARLLDRVAHAPDVACVMAMALVHPANTDSQNLLGRKGFFYLRENGQYQEWWARFDNPATEDPEEIENS